MTAPTEGDEGRRALVVYILLIVALMGIGIFTIPFAIGMVSLGAFRRDTPPWVRSHYWFQVRNILIFVISITIVFVTLPGVAAEVRWAGDVFMAGVVGLVFFIVRCFWGLAILYRAQGGSGMADLANQARESPVVLMPVCRNHGRLPSASHHGIELSGTSLEREGVLFGFCDNHRAGEHCNDHICKGFGVFSITRPSPFLVSPDPFGDSRTPTVIPARQRRSQIRIRKRKFQRKVAKRTTQHLSLLIERRRHGFEDPQYPFASARRLTHGRHPGIFDLCNHPLIDHRQRQGLLGREMMMESTAGHAGRADEILRAGATIPSCLERPIGHIQHPVAHAHGIVGSLLSLCLHACHPVNLDKTDQSVCFTYGDSKATFSPTEPAASRLNAPINGCRMRESTSWRSGLSQAVNLESKNLKIDSPLKDRVFSGG